MGKLKELRLSNMLKVVHGWQNDGQQNELFYENNKDYRSPAGCKQLETRMNSAQCTEVAL